MKNIIFWISLLCSLSILGCAQKEERTHPMKNEKEYSVDASQCQRKADKASTYYPPDFVIMSGAEQNTLEQIQKQQSTFDRCMQEKGYRPVNK